MALQRRLTVAMFGSTYEAERKLDDSLWVCIDRPSMSLAFHDEHFETGNADQDGDTVMENDHAIEPVCN